MGPNTTEASGDPSQLAATTRFKSLFNNRVVAASEPVNNRVVAASEPVASRGRAPRYAPNPLASCLSAVSTERADATMSELSGSAWREWICTT